MDLNKKSVEIDAIWQRVDGWLSQSLTDMIDMRRDLHAHPEPAGEETRTTSIVDDHITRAGLDSHGLNGQSGLCVDLNLTTTDAPRLAIRADMDCVEVDDDKDVPWRSTRSGCCHACGHDAHTTMATWALAALAQEKDALSEIGPHCNLRFIFQPAEESATGAIDMIERGALQGVDHIIALHCDPFLDTGRVGLRTGPITANLRSFRILLRGQGGHSARPHESIDPVPAAVNLVSMLYQLGPRSVDSRHAHCITVTSIRTGQTINAIPDTAEIYGTIRAARTDEGAVLEKMVGQCADAVCTATGCRVEIEFPHAAPATNNDPLVVEMIAQSAVDIVGQDGVIRLDLPSLGGEDFAIYQQHIPGAMARLGTGAGPMNTRHALHSGRFDIDESALLVGSRLLARTALQAATSNIAQGDGDA